MQYDSIKCRMNFSKIVCRYDVLRSSSERLAWSFIIKKKRLIRTFPPEKTVTGLENFFHVTINSIWFSIMKEIKWHIMFQMRCWWRDDVFLSRKSFCNRTVKNIIHSWISSDQSLRFFLYKMRNQLRKIINLLKFPNCNTVKWSILQKWSQTVDLIHTYLARRRWYDSNWLDFDENYSSAKYQLQNYDVRRFYWLTIWMRLEWTQSISSPFSSTPIKRRRDPWSSTIFRNTITGSVLNIYDLVNHV